MIRIEIDDQDPIAQALDRLVEEVVARQHAYKEQYDTLSKEEQAKHPTPFLDTRESVMQRVLSDGLANVGDFGRAPTSVLSLKPNIAGPYTAGMRIELRGCLFPGVELMWMEATREDGPSWDVDLFSIGSLPLIERRGGGGAVPLTSLLRLSRRDLLCSFNHQRMLFDTQINITLVCKKDTPSFDGYRVFLFSEESLCVMPARLEPVSCDHPQNKVTRLEFVDYRRSVQVPQWLSAFNTTCQPPRYRCRQCGRLVHKIEDKTP